MQHLLRFFIFICAPLVLSGCQLATQEDRNWLHTAPYFASPDNGQAPYTDGLKALNGKFHYSPSYQ